MYTLYLFEKIAVVLVSSPEYSGWASILQGKLLDRWEMVLNIANIQGIPFVGDRKCCICGRLS